MGDMVTNLRRLSVNTTFPLDKYGIRNMTATGPFNPTASPGIYPTSAAKKAITAGDKVSGYREPPPETPITPTPVTPIPGNDPNDLNVIAARRRSIEQQLFRRGRLSTILTQQQTEPLGG